MPPLNQPGSTDHHHPINNSGGGGDYFNSDSFRATDTQDARHQAGVIDLQYHRQPFNDDEDYEEDKDSNDNRLVSDREGVQNNHD